ncbi:hypothetical protein Poly24_32040 [Rosistilla carotiformis]|uniref:Uncharacterized protein n=1 Tax=Rosistilla carotiformis TaxID=2528017 RepID=A0A518JVD3_9BACT|nr:hypothetical protein [Rosistilla carotiformis]QDV69488.1 hypothetical protein Poly24_32040 [Rosistilla carotiformis]
MNPDSERTNETAAQAAPPRFQISLSTMLLITVVFSVMSAGLFHASRIPAINAELASMSQRAGSGKSSDRSLQIVFIMFTYSMPLLMAGLLASMSTIWKWWHRNR